MGLFRRIFSTDFRKAVAAEAEGDYLTAARCYALCGEPHKVVDMHLALARQAEDGEDRIRELRLALHFATGDERRRPMVLRLLAEALAKQGRAQGAGTPNGRESLQEAAGLLMEGEGWQQAGDIYLELGDRETAASAYARGGLVERVEEVLGEEERQRERSLTEDQQFKEYELRMNLGQRDEAAEALRRCVEAAAEPGEYRRLLSDLERRLLHGGRLTLQSGEQSVVVVGRLPLIIGRDPDCDLVVRGHSVSRRHACIIEGPAGSGLMVEDMGSRNGTTLAGILLGARVPLPPGGILGLGDGSEVKFIQDPYLELEVSNGMDLGARALYLPGELYLSEVFPGGPGLRLSFERGRPIMEAPERFMLNGEATQGVVQLIAGDTLAEDGARVEVEA